MAFEKRKIIIDSDPGIDDAFAIFFAMSRPEFEILGITTVAGNSPIDTTTKNALRIVDFAGNSQIPVVCGHEKPLNNLLSFENGDCFHGVDGLGGSKIPYSENRPRESSAEDFLISTLEANEPGTVTLVTIGPMTNIAAAIEKNPEAMKRAKEIFSMGGAVLHGNMTPVAEFNYWSDPEAAAVCYASGIPIYMIGLNATEQVVITEENAARLRKGGKITNAMADMLVQSFANHRRDYGINGMIPHDLLAMAACLDPEIVSWTHCTVNISCTKVTRGECIADLVDAWKQPKNCYVAGKVDKDKFLRLFFDSLLG